MHPHIHTRARYGLSPSPLNAFLNACAILSASPALIPAGASCSGTCSIPSLPLALATGAGTETGAATASSIGSPLPSLVRCAFAAASIPRRRV